MTSEHYQRFLKANPKIHHMSIPSYSPDADGPAISVTWFEAAAYCNWLSEQDGLPRDQWCYEPNRDGLYEEEMRIPRDILSRRGYRLPTQAEWEYACRSGAATSRYYGSSDSLLGAYGWYLSNAKNRAWPCGTLQPNDLGCFDMLGNVIEWCLDGVSMKLAGMSSVLDDDRREDEIVPLARPRILRGSFIHQPDILRSALQYWNLPTDSNINVGFRPARTLGDGLAARVRDDTPAREPRRPGSP